jgi:transcriptional regulator of heat shock response
MNNQILELQQNQEDMNRKIARLVSKQTDSLSFSVSANSESVTGIKHLLQGQIDQAPVSEVLEFLDNLDEYKQFLLTDQTIQQKKSRKIKTVFGAENGVLPLGKGYTLVATEILIGTEKTVIGIISPTHLLTNPKKLLTLEAISKALEKNKLR